MANVQTFIKRIEFSFQEESTVCNIFYSSSEPGHPVWGGGWKTKNFPASKTALSIIMEDAGDYLCWVDGREEIDK
jgi:hypothetical protein